MTNKKSIFSSTLRLIVALILLQTLFYKFTAHPDSVHIFSALGIEPWGRIGLGVVELITATLILIPKTKMIGMLNAMLIIIGALISHFLVLGINVSGDGGRLFLLAVIVFIASGIYLYINKMEVMVIIKKLSSK